MTAEQLGKLVKTRRKAKSLTRADVIEQSGIVWGEFLIHLEEGTGGYLKLSTLIRIFKVLDIDVADFNYCLLYTSPSPRDKRQSRMPSSA